MQVIEGYVSIRQLAKMVGVNHFVVHYHIKKGFVAAPTHLIGTRYFYKPEELKPIKQYFANWQKYIHHAKGEK